MLQFIYLFTYLTGFMKQGLIYAKLGLNLWCFCFHCPSIGTITNSDFSHGIGEGIETRGQGGPTTSDAAYQQGGSNLSLGLHRSDLENPVWFTGILALEHQQAREKVTSGRLILSSRIADAEPSSLKVFENVWVCIQLNFNRG